MTDSVHAADGRIFVQLWHVGRVSHATLQPNGQAPVAPSAIRANTKTVLTTGFTEVSEPRALEIDEISAILADYGHAAESAKRAGFDGVEIHGANGYLIDQFLRDGSNKRTDSYGGGIENRLRFALEVVDVIVKVWGSSRVGVRIAPVSPANDIQDSHPTALFGALVEKKLDQRGLGHDPMSSKARRWRGATQFLPFDFAALRKSFRGRLYRQQQRLHQGYGRSTSSGRSPDLDRLRSPVHRQSRSRRAPACRLNAPWRKSTALTLYGGGEKGYTDYPAMAVA